MRRAANVGPNLAMQNDGPMQVSALQPQCHAAMQLWQHVPAGTRFNSRMELIWAWARNAPALDLPANVSFAIGGTGPFALQYVVVQARRGTRRSNVHSR